MAGSKWTAQPRAGILVAFAVLVTTVTTVVVAAVVLAWRVDGVSMAPTIHNEDRVLVRPGNSFDRFDVIVGRFSERGPEFVKRVIGLPGDNISIEQSGNGRGIVRLQPAGSGPWLVVTNTAWDQLWQNSITQNCCRGDGTSSVEPTVQRIPDGSVFVLGDNLAASEDSRKHGWVRTSLIEGPVVFRVLPLGSIGPIARPVTTIPAQPE